MDNRLIDNLMVVLNCPMKITGEER